MVEFIETFQKTYAGYDDRPDAVWPDKGKMTVTICSETPTDGSCGLLSKRIDNLRGAPEQGRWILRAKWGIMDEKKNWRDEVVRRSRISAVKTVEKLAPELHLSEREYERWIDQVGLIFLLVGLEKLMEKLLTLLLFP